MPRLREWLQREYHGSMGWMAEREAMRGDPATLVDGCISVISARMNYLPEGTEPLRILEQPERAYVSRYALGRDYHKLVRTRLARLGEWIREQVESDFGMRPFVDSAPVLEKPFARKAGLGWIGKNTLLLNRDRGSWFFLGELLTTLPLAEPVKPAADECGKCRACLTVCPTDAFPQPYVLDARRCISYLTIEHDGPIPEPLRAPMGNRVFGCDDCQLVCPWNRYAQHTGESDFQPRHQLDSASLVHIFSWSEAEFLRHTAGSPIRRTGYQRWRRNLAVGLGNGPATPDAIQALEAAREDSSLVREHAEWALHRLRCKRDE